MSTNHNHRPCKGYTGIQNRQSRWCIGITPNQWFTNIILSANFLLIFNIFHYCCPLSRYFIYRVTIHNNTFGWVSRVLYMFKISLFAEQKLKSQFICRIKIQKQLVPHYISGRQT